MSSDTETIADPISSELSAEFMSTGRRPCLVILAGAEAGKVIPLNPGSQTLGRTEESTVVVPHSSISRHHAEIIVQGVEKVWIRDLGSTNGTRVNGNALTDALHPLQPDDRIRLSKQVLLKYNLQDALEAELQQGLYSSAMRDGLTGAFNKRFLLDRLDEEFAHASRHGRSLAVLVMDLDHFKKVNDAFGHAAGDQVLVDVAALVQANLRTADLFARYGGEEFVVLMRDTDLNTATSVAERMRVSLAEEVTVFKGTPIRTTVSIGVTAMPPVRVGSAMELFVRADRLLYQAKETGRNRVCSEVPPGS